jgi:hypothetical protein
MIGTRFLSRYGTFAAALGLAVACSHAPLTAPNLAECDAGPQCGTTGGIVGGGGTSSDSGGPNACGVLVYRDSICNTCVTRECCARDVTCSNNADCLALAQCISACPSSDTMCVPRCRSQSNAIADYDNFVTCVAMGCGNECAGSEAGAACGSLVFSPLACDTCVNASCCGDDLACSNSPDCVAIVRCVASQCQAGDQACITNCETLYPGGEAIYRSLAQCVLTSCSTQCP